MKYRSGSAMTLSLSLVLAGMPVFAQTLPTDIETHTCLSDSSVSPSGLSAAQSLENDTEEKRCHSDIQSEASSPFPVNDAIKIADRSQSLQLSRTLAKEPASADPSGMTGDFRSGQFAISSESSSLDLPHIRQGPLVTAKLESITNEVLKQEIELLKLNTRFRMETTEKSRIKPWRVFLYNLAGSGVSTAGITTVAAERWRTWRQPAKASRNTLKAGPIMLLIGHSIMAGGILVEVTLDTINDLKQRKAGLDAKSTQRRVIELCQAIDEKLKERGQLLSGLDFLSKQEFAALSLEGLVLNDLRHMALQEYLQFHIRAKKRTVSRNVSYLNQFSAATTGGYLGSLCGLLAVSNRKPKLAGPAGLGFTISGANIATGPILGKLAQGFAGNLTRKRLKRELPPIEPAQLQEHLSMLKEQLSPDDTSLSARLSVYETADAIFKQQAQMNAAEKKKADKEFIERCLFNACIGGTKMAWGIQLMNAGFGFDQPPPAPKITGPKTSVQKALDALPKPKSASQLFSQRVAQGATSYIPGTSLWIIDTLQARARGELDVYTMGQQAALPHQKLKDRLTRLEGMESKLKETVQPPI